jgi:hypothetical protein
MGVLTEDKPRNGEHHENGEEITVQPSSSAANRTPTASLKVRGNCIIPFKSCRQTNQPPLQKYL